MLARFLRAPAGRWQAAAWVALCVPALVAAGSGARVLAGRSADHALVTGASGPARIWQWPPAGTSAGEGPGLRSSNWSGYAVGHGSVRAVHARWVVPAATCRAGDSNVQDSAFWVGIDGLNSRTVEQDGTDVRCLPHSTTPVYTAWWEMYPTNNVQPVFSVHPGDHIDASVTVTSGTYSLVVQDLSSHASFTKRVRCGAGLTCPNSSAEWIAESPSYSTGLADLAQYKTWQPTSMTMSLTGGPTVGPAAFTYNPITMVTSTNIVRAKVSADLLGAAKNTFVDTLVHAAAN